MCFSLPTASQNAPETRDQIPQLLPGEGDRPLPQAGTYSYGMEVAPREQTSPPPSPACSACPGFLPPRKPLLPLPVQPLRLQAAFQGRRAASSQVRTCTGGGVGGHRSVSARSKWVMKILQCTGEWTEAFWVGFTQEGPKGPCSGSLLGEQSRVVPAGRH